MKAYLKNINALSVLVLLLSSFQLSAASKIDADAQATEFYNKVMNAPAILPANIEDSFISCPLSKVNLNNSNAKHAFKTSDDIHYDQGDWEQRISADWGFFSSSEQIGRVLVIDFANTESGLGYRYLANDMTQNQLFEPWSSSKVLAFSAAVSKARDKSNGKVGAASLAGDHPLADLITSINSYEPFGVASANSNAIATYFLNLVGRDKATALFHQDWLRLSNEDIRFRGAYETDLFRPSNALWKAQNSDISVAMPKLLKNRDDPGYQEYRCDECGLTGNKPMTTLAQAEWLKRLAAHERDQSTRMPDLHANDVEVLFYATGHSDKINNVGGMMLGISNMLQHAIAKAILEQGSSDKLGASSKAILDAATKGQWRVWQKIGWGPSETRGAGENVVLAHVCLPHFQGGREFTVSAQAISTARHDEPDEIDVGYAGLKMQTLLDNSMAQLLALPQE